MTVVNNRSTGPVNLSKRVIGAMQKQAQSHRSAEFKAFYKALMNKLCRLVNAKNIPLIFTSSGTGAMDAVAMNLSRSGDKVLTISCGYYGFLFHSMFERQPDVNAELFRFDPTKAFPFDALLTMLSQTAYDLVVFTHNESSMGACVDIGRLSRIIRANSNALIVVDGISSVGGVALSVADDLLDILITVPQKALGAPAGSSIVFYSDQAAQKFEQHSNSVQTMAFNFSRCRAKAEQCEPLTTPCLHSLWGLNESLEDIFAQGAERVFDRHLQVAEQFRQGLVAIGAKVHIHPSLQSPTITAFGLPDGHVPERFTELLLKRFGIVVGVSVDNKNILRVGHMGHVESDEVEHFFASMKTAMLEEDCHVT